MTAAITCKHLTLDYHNGTIIGPINLEAESGTCVALVGPNGAGKTSFLHLLLGLRYPSLGEVTIFGKTAGDPESRYGVGYLQEVVDFPERAKAESILQLHCKMTGALNGGKISEMQEYLDAFGLEWSSKPLRIYSKGMKQRLALAVAMLDCSRLLILDEPNSGLDPVGIAMLRTKLEAVKRAGTTILLSTHRLAEAMLLADRVMVLSRGKITGDAPVTDFSEYDSLEKYFLACVR